MAPQDVVLATGSCGPIASTVIHKLARRYYARMASLALVALVLGWLQRIVANDPSHMPSMGPVIALGIGAANVIAAWFLFGTIRRGA